MSPRSVSTPIANQSELRLDRNPALPYPPLQLAERVGSLAGAEDPYATYDRYGRETREGIISRLPDDWDFRGKRVLDFGCGAGRTLRHFIPETEVATFIGCDIDEPSIAWLKEHLSPPFEVFLNGDDPPLDLPSESIDLIFAISVFSHLADNWSTWLVELHRVLVPGGLLLATFMSRGMSEIITGEKWDDTHFGMNVIRSGQPWDLGGPMVLHAPWWIEEHWGRCFEIVSIEPDGFASNPWLDHGIVLLRKQDTTADAAELARVDLTNKREITALIHNLAQVRRESQELRNGVYYLQAQNDELSASHTQRTAELAQRTAELAQRTAELAQRTYEVNDLRPKAAALLQTETELAKALEQVAQQKLNEDELRSCFSEECHRLSERYQLTEDHLARANRAISDITGSLSWRMTAPLRATLRALRRLVHIR
jgi:SAM-dependent methyltransferase